MVVSDSSSVDDAVFAVGEETSASIGVKDIPVLSEDLLRDAVEDRYTEAVDLNVPVCDGVGVLVDVDVLDKVAALNSIDASDSVEVSDDVGVLDEVDVSEEVSASVTVTVLEVFDDLNGVDLSYGVNSVVESDVLGGVVVVAVLAFHQRVVVEQPSQFPATVVEALALIEDFEVEVEDELSDPDAEVAVTSIVSIAVVDGVTDSLPVSILCSSIDVTETEVEVVVDFVFSAERAQDGVTGLMVKSTSSRAAKLLIPTAKVVSAEDTSNG
ncbi:hypothetical protein N7486_008342 [Penicillium sp. IBT 16267x]|nr:hypothetical protein N7486_008342 [Penicillium sp. IBT 16267x]